MSYYVKKVGDAATLSILMTKSGSGLTGLSPTIEIRRMSDGFYLDFNATVAPYWKTSGGSKEKTLPERVWLPGYYTWVFDQSIYEDGGVVAEYTVIYRHGTPYRTLLTETWSFEYTSDDRIERVINHLENYQELEKLAEDHWKHTVFEDDKTTPMHTADITLSGNKEIRDPS